MVLGSVEKLWRKEAQKLGQEPKPAQEIPAPKPPYPPVVAAPEPPKLPAPQVITQPHPCFFQPLSKIGRLRRPMCFGRQRSLSDLQGVRNGSSNCRRNWCGGFPVLRLQGLDGSTTCASASTTPPACLTPAATAPSHWSVNLFQNCLKVRIKYFYYDIYATDHLFVSRLLLEEDIKWVAKPGMTGKALFLLGTGIAQACLSSSRGGYRGLSCGAFA